MWAGVLGDGDDVVPFARGDASPAGGAGRAARGGDVRPTRRTPVGAAVPLASVRLLAPVGVPPSIRDFYAFEDHVATARKARGLEMDPDWYELPVFYFTNPAAVRGPDDDIAVPAGTEALDYELEVAAVIGVECADVDPADWLDVVAGLHRDERLVGPRPPGPRDAPGPRPGQGQGLRHLARARARHARRAARRGGRAARAASMVARVDGVEWSRGHLGSLHFTWGELIAHASRSTVLRPGDVIGSGTVGTGCILELSLVHGSDRYPWLRPGQVVELEVEGIGVLRNRVVALSAEAGRSVRCADGRTRGA